MTKMFSFSSYPHESILKGWRKKAPKVPQSTYHVIVSKLASLGWSERLDIKDFSSELPEEEVVDEKDISRERVREFEGLKKDYVPPIVKYLKSIAVDPIERGKKLHEEAPIHSDLWKEFTRFYKNIKIKGKVDDVEIRNGEEIIVEWKYPITHPIPGKTLFQGRNQTLLYLWAARKAKGELQFRDSDHNVIYREEIFLEEENVEEYLERVYGVLVDLQVIEAWDETKDYLEPYLGEVFIPKKDLEDEANTTGTSALYDLERKGQIRIIHEE